MPRHLIEDEDGSDGDGDDEDDDENGYQAVGTGFDSYQFSPARQRRAQQQLKKCSLSCIYIYTAQIVLQPTIPAKTFPVILNP